MLGCEEPPQKGEIQRDCIQENRNIFFKQRVQHSKGLGPSHTLTALEGVSSPGAQVKRRAMREVRLKWRAKAKSWKDLCEILKVNIFPKCKRHVLVCWDCHSPVLQAGELKQWKSSPHSLKAGCLSSRGWQDGFLLRPLCLVCSQPPSHVHTWFSCADLCPGLC